MRLNGTHKKGKGLLPLIMEKFSLAEWKQAGGPDKLNSSFGSLRRTLGCKSQMSMPRSSISQDVMLEGQGHESTQGHTALLHHQKLSHEARRWNPCCSQGQGVADFVCYSKGKIAMETQLPISGPECQLPMETLRAPKG